MDILDSLNTILATNADLLGQLEMMFRIKFWLLLALAVYFLSLPYREQRKRAQLNAQAINPNGKGGKFLA